MTQEERNNLQVGDYIMYKDDIITVEQVIHIKDETEIDTQVKYSRIVAPSLRASLEYEVCTLLNERYSVISVAELDTLIHKYNLN